MSEHRKSIFWYKCVIHNILGNWGIQICHILLPLYNLSPFSLSKSFEIYTADQEPQKESQVWFQAYTKIPIFPVSAQ